MLKCVIPESKAVDHGHATQSFNFQINVSEFNRDEWPLKTQSGYIN